MAHLKNKFECVFCTFVHIFRLLPVEEDRLRVDLDSGRLLQQPEALAPIL